MILWRTPPNSATDSFGAWMWCRCRSHSRRSLIQLYRDILKMRSSVQCCRAWIDALTSKTFAVRSSVSNTSLNFGKNWATSCQLHIWLTIQKFIYCSIFVRRFTFFLWILCVIEKADPTRAKIKINELIVGKTNARANNLESTSEIRRKFYQRESLLSRSTNGKFIACILILSVCVNECMNCEVNFLFHFPHMWTA